MHGNASLTQSPRLLDQMRGKIRLKHYSLRTEQAYVDWIKRFVLHFDKRHPAEMGAPEVEAFLTHLAVQGKVAASTQNQAKAALLFLYREVLEQDLPWLQNVEPAKAPKRLPVPARPLAAAARSPGTGELGVGYHVLRCNIACRFAVAALEARHARSSAGLMS